MGVHRGGGALVGFDVFRLGKVRKKDLDQAIDVEPSGRIKATVLPSRRGPALNRGAVAGRDA